MAFNCKWCELGECWTHRRVNPPQGGTNGANGGFKGKGSWGNGGLGGISPPQQSFQQPPGFDPPGLGGGAGWKGWGKNPMLQPQQQPAATPVSGIGANPDAGVETSEPVDLSGDWKITDDKGNILDYVFEHALGKTFFRGTLQGTMQVAGQVKGAVIGWQVSDIRCKGTLAHAGTTIMNGTCWSKADGTMLGTFVGEKIEGRPPPPDIDGTWTITDQKQNAFVYHFEQTAGESSFGGRQEGGKAVKGVVTDESIEWEVHDVCCKGEISSDGMRITKGTYWKKADGKHLGFFTGQKKDKSQPEMPTCPAKHTLEECESNKDLACKECGKGISKLTTFMACKKCRYHICPGCLSKLISKKNKDKENAPQNGGGKEKTASAAGLTTCPKRHPLEECKCGKDLNCKECGRTIPKETNFHACKQCRYHICPRCHTDGPPEKKGDLTCPAKHVLEECKCPQDLKCKECRGTIRAESSFQACKKCRYHICHTCEQKKRQETSKWMCPSCRTDNYPTWSECFGCKRPRPSSSSSQNKRSRSRGEKRPRSRGRSRSNDRNDGKKARGRSPSGSIERVIKAITKADFSSANERIERGKADAVEELRKIKLAPTKDERRSKFKALLVRWHPDKNLDRQEVATAVFQFLSKGKKMLNES